MENVENEKKKICRLDTEKCLSKRMCDEHATWHYFLFSVSPPVTLMLFVHFLVCTFVCAVLFINERIPLIGRLSGEWAKIGHKHTQTECEWIEASSPTAVQCQCQCTCGGEKRQIGVGELMQREPEATDILGVLKAHTHTVTMYGGVHAPRARQLWHTNTVVGVVSPPTRQRVSVHLLKQHTSIYCT